MIRTVVASLEDMVCATRNTRKLSYGLREEQYNLKYDVKIKLKTHNRSMLNRRKTQCHVHKKCLCLSVNIP